MVRWWCAVALLALPAPAAGAKSEPVLPLGAQECITAQRPDLTWPPPTCHDTHHAPIPDGPIGAIVHTHPGGSSLSLADLRLLARVEHITAVTGQARYTARRAPA